ncbi:unnamed protein product [Orchesella dallaii]|uniref:DUF4789 domain-containing protein n=1 Tax=Orchesella dallaii TaxID=48710 RepID=A0ABP1QER2_9HEXA
MNFLLVILISFNILQALGYGPSENVGLNNGDCSVENARAKTNTTPKLLLDRKTGRCYEIGTRGPCGLNMIFYKDPREPTSPYGFCDCDQGVRSEYPCSDHPVRQMIYVSKLKQCFPVFSQGPCRNGYWLNLGEADEKPECQPNPCERSLNSRTRNLHRFWFYDPLRKSCYETQTRGYCPVGLTLEVRHNTHIPKCRRKQCHSALGRVRTPLVCKSGSRYSYFLKGCRRSLKLYF